MTTHIIWAVIWFLIMLVSFYGGALAAWFTGVASFILPSKAPTGRRAVGSVALGVLVLLVGLALAAFSLIKVILQIIAAFQAA